MRHSLTPGGLRAPSTITALSRDELAEELRAIETTQQAMIKLTTNQRRRIVNWLNMWVSSEDGNDD